VSGAGFLQLLEYAVAKEPSLCSVTIARDGATEGLVPYLLRLVLQTVISLEEAIEKGAEAGSDAGTDYLDPSLYALEDCDEDGEGDGEREEDDEEVRVRREEAGTPRIEWKSLEILSQSCSVGQVNMSPRR
jgi:hypothetical protein